MSDKPSPKIIMIALVIVGLLCLWTGTSRFISAWNAGNWAVCKGTILESSLEEKWDPESSSLIPHLSYEYMVDGKRYTSSQISLAQQSLDKGDWAEKVIKRFPKGTSVDVHYNPLDPWEAAIYVNVTPVSYAQPIMGFFMVIAAVVIFIRQRKQKCLK